MRKMFSEIYLFVFEINVFKIFHKNKNIFSYTTVLFESPNEIF